MTGNGQLDVEDSYVARYIRSHQKADLAYKSSYREYLIIDNLFEAPYSALIVGCGTLGAPLRLLKGASRILGVDRSEKMLAAAKKIASDCGKSGVELVQSDVRAFVASAREQFDFIELGLMGTYLPLDIDVVESCAKILRAGGVLLVSTAVITPFNMRLPGDSFRYRAPIASFLSSMFFVLTGSPNRRISVSVYAVMRAMSAWLGGRNGVDFKLLFQGIQKDGVDQPAVYRALIRKL
jgi:SAM-dependent methyltransferase